jgi:hypothetical protein
VAADLIDAGPAFNDMMRKACFGANGLRLIGFGAPVTVFAVRSFKDGKVGCAVPIFTDYVTVLFNPPTFQTWLSDDETERGEVTRISTLAHELAHSCNLPHFNDPENLLNDSATPGLPFTQRSKLTNFQKAVLRNSRHVTFF